MVGLVKDSEFRSAVEGPVPVCYVPFWQSPDEIDTRFAIRVKSDPHAMLALLGSTIAEIDPHVPVTELTTLLDQVESNFMQARLAAAVLVCASVLALLLSVVGLYALITYYVCRRTREIGIRIAVGTTPSGVRAFVLRQSLAIVGPGIILGFVVALAATRLPRSWLYGVQATDPSAFGI